MDYSIDDDANADDELPNLLCGSEGREGRRVSPRGDIRRMGRSPFLNPEFARWKRARVLSQGWERGLGSCWGVSLDRPRESGIPVGHIEWGIPVDQNENKIFHKAFITEGLSLSKNQWRPRE